MNAKYIVFAIAFFLASLLFAYHYSYFPFTKKEPLVCLYFVKQLGEKDQLDALYADLKTINVSKKQVIENPVVDIKGTKVKIFFDQSKFDSIAVADNSHLNIGIGLKNSFEIDEHKKIIGVFDHDKMLNLVELVQKILPETKDFLVVYEQDHKNSSDNLKKLKDLLALKGIHLRECVLDRKCNVATQLKDISKTIQAVIMLPSELILQEEELILEHFKSVKVPVFANHVGLIKSGALAGFGYDVQDISYAVTQVIGEYLESDGQEINDDILAELMPQLHVNMDVLKHLGINLSDGLLDEAVTVGSADL